MSVCAATLGRGVAIESSKTLDQKAFPLGLGVRRSSNIARFGVDDKGVSEHEQQLALCSE